MSGSHRMIWMSGQSVKQLRRCCATLIPVAWNTNGARSEVGKRLIDGKTRWTRRPSTRHPTPPTARKPAYRLPPWHTLWNCVYKIWRPLIMPVIYNGALPRYWDTHTPKLRTRHTIPSHVMDGITTLVGRLGRQIGTHEQQTRNSRTNQPTVQIITTGPKKKYK